MAAAGSPDDARITAVALLVEASGAVLGSLARDLEATSGLPLPWFGVLVRLARAPGGRLRMADIASAVSVTTSGATRIVDRMEAAGLVCRESCPSDRRGSFAVLTPEGERALGAATPDHLRAIDTHFTGRIDLSELEAFLAVLTKLRDVNWARPGTADEREG